MLKPFTMAAIALATVGVIAPPRADAGPPTRDRAGQTRNGPELTGAHFETPLNGPSLSGQVGPLAPDEAGMQVIGLRRPTTAK